MEAKFQRQGVFWTYSKRPSARSGDELEDLSTKIDSRTTSPKSYLLQHCKLVSSTSCMYFITQIEHGPRLIQEQTKLNLEQVRDAFSNIESQMDPYRLHSV